MENLPTKQQIRDAKSYNTDERVKMLQSQNIPFIKRDVAKMNDRQFLNYSMATIISI